jgi:EpsI family protein
MSQQPARFAVALLLLVGATWCLHARQNHERVPARVELSSFPLQLDGWSGIDLPIDESTQKVLHAGDLLLRQYAKDSDTPVANLFIAYFPTQRTGATYHSPNNCAPASGWYPVSKTVISIEGDGYEPVQANQFVVEKNGERQLVIYWYLSHGHAVASEYRAKVLLVADSIKFNRSDGALIRINTAIQPAETVDDAMARLAPFAKLVIPRLEAYVPR